MVKTTRPISTLATPYLHRRAFLQRSAAASGIFMLPAGLGQMAMAQDMTKMVHQLGWVKSIQFGGHFAAIENGYFAEEGIEAEFLAGGPGGIGTDVAVASGQAMTSDTDVEGTIRARIGGLPVRAFGAIMQKAPGAIMSLAENPLTALADFPGKTIALPDGLRPQLSALMTTAGIDPASVTFVPVGTDPGILAAGQVDGYYGWATNQGVMLQTRGVDIAVAYMNDLGVPGYAGVLIATDEMIDTQPDLLTAWLRAEIKGWQWHLDNPEEMAVLMVEKYGQRGLDLTAQTLESKMMADFVPVGDAATNGLLWIEPATFEQGIDFVVAAGELAEGAMTADDAMTQDLIRAAHAG
jgi:NitT/TauT family transport system substrate-binding protein